MRNASAGDWFVVTTIGKKSAPKPSAITGLKGIDYVKCVFCSTHRVKRKELRLTTDTWV